jgi:hypothetical protein
LPSLPPDASTVPSGENATAVGLCFGALQLATGRTDASLRLWDVFARKLVAVARSRC